VISYDLIAHGSGAPIIVTDSQPLHGGTANRVEILQK
jgi:hypothetical protein